MQLDFLKLCFFGSSCDADPPMCASMPPLGEKIAIVKPWEQEMYMTQSASSRAAESLIRPPQG